MCSLSGLSSHSSTACSSDPAVRAEGWLEPLCSLMLFSPVRSTSHRPCPCSSLCLFNRCHPLHEEQTGEGREGHRVLRLCVSPSTKKAIITILTCVRALERVCAFRLLSPPPPQSPRSFQGFKGPRLRPSFWFLMLEPNLTGAVIRAGTL